MFRYIFFVLLFLIIYYIFGPVHAENSTLLGRIELFAANQTRVPDKVGDINPNKNSVYFSSPFLVAADGVMVALVEAIQSENEDKRVDIAARYIETEGTKWEKKLIDDNGANWKTQLAMHSKDEKDCFSELRRPMAVAKGNKIYLFAISYNKSKSAFHHQTKPDWNFEMTIGEVKPTSRPQGGKTIEWQPHFTLSTLTQQFKNQSLDVFPYGSHTLFTGDGRILFVIKAKRGVKEVSAIIFSKGTGNESELDCLYVEASEGYHLLSFFLWKEKVIMVTRCPDGSNEVKESNDMGKTWTDAVGTVARLWDNLHNEKDFTTVSIENKTVLLFTRLMITVTKTLPMYEIHLWFSDGVRVHCVGPIVAGFKYVTSSGLLYTNGELFALYQQWNSRGLSKIILTHLKDELERIKSVLRISAERDTYLSKPCNEAAYHVASLEPSCVTPMPTDGLVAFLSNKTIGGVWQDDYLCVNATVKRGTKVDNGFMFGGIGSGAIWSVGQQGLDQRYNFVRHGLTVVATVTIHEVPRGDSTSLFTFGSVWDDERLGLWYGKNKQWRIMFKNGATPGGAWVTCEAWEINKTYRVAFMLYDNRFYAYVDGERVGGGLRISAPGEEPLNFRHLFIAGYEDDSETDAVSHITVTNVFLYNRPFNDTEFNALIKKENYTSEANRAWGKLCTCSSGWNTAVCAGFVGPCCPVVTDHTK